MSKAKIITVAVICILLVSAIIFGVLFAIDRRQIEKYKKMPLQLPDGFTYTAHTGCMDTQDNSLESIDAAVQFGAQIVEFDLNFTADGNPVLAHDAPKGNEVTLDEAFKKVSEYDNLKANVDVKNTAALEKIKPLAEKHGILDRIFYTGIEEKDVDAVAKSSPEINYYLNVDVLPPQKQNREYLISLAKKVKDCGAVGINFNKDNATKELVDIFHENGLLVSIWTVSNDKDIYRILSYAPDNITTRRPDKLQKALEK